MNEYWRLIEDFDGYEVSNRGRVRSIDREINVVGPHQKRSYKGRIIKSVFDGHGYERVCLWRGNRQYGRIVHRLVVEAFLRKIADDEEVNHLDHNKKNNALENLEITTPADNIAYAMNAGRMAKKLTEQQVSEIKSRLRLGEHKQTIAVLFKVSRANINSIAFNRTWQRVT